MRKIFFNGLTAIAAIAILAGCVSLIGCSSISDTATVTYDVTATPPMEVQRQADMQCAKVNKYAVRRKTSSVGPAPNTRNDDFDCIDHRDDSRNNSR